MISALPNSDPARYAPLDSELPHVLLVLDQLPKTLGGGERIVLRLAELLPKYGFRASILTFFAHPDCNGMGSWPCPVYVLPLKRTYDPQAFKAAIELQQLIRNQKIQIVHTFFESSNIWAGLVTKILSAAKLVSTRRDMGILRTRKHRVAYRLMAKFPDAVFCVSDEVRKHCILMDRIDPTRVHTIYNGIDLPSWDAVERVRERADPIHVTTVGNIRRVKGHDILVKAAALVVEQCPGVLFTVAGDPLEEPYFAELQTMVQDLHLQDNVHFIGGIADVKQHLSGADVFVLPSRSEGFSNAIVEAMAASLPVIATDVGGNAEAVSDGITGIIVEPKNPAVIAAAILELLSDPAQARAMGAAGKRRAAEMFTTEAMMGRIASAYTDLFAE